MKQATSLGPDFRIAQPEDVALIHHSDRPIPDNFAPGEKQVAERFRACREALGSQATLREATYPAGDQENGDKLPIESWDDLAAHTSAWVGEFIESRNLSAYAALQGDSIEKTVWHVKDAARAAIVLSSAFMEVVAKVKAPDELADPDREIADTVLASQGVVLEMASMDAGVTRGLAAALADPSTPRDVDTAFDSGLRFNKENFIEEEGKVLLDPAKTDQLRHSKNKSHNPHYPKIVEKHPTAEDKGGRLFACPERHMAPYILKRMANDAAEAGLFKQTYEAERAVVAEQSQPVPA